MWYELFIAKKIIRGSSEKGQGSIAQVSAPVIRIAAAGVALGLALMIIAVAVVSGFQKEIRDKVSGFSGHVRVSTLEDNSSYEKLPLNREDNNLRTVISHTPGVRHFQPYITKAGVIRTETDIEGIVLKGLAESYDRSFLNKWLVEGQLFEIRENAKSDSILVSKHTAAKLRLKVGDRVTVYFVQQPPRVRKFFISGIFETGMEDIDRTYAICDMGHLQKLNDWTAGQVSGIEVFTDNFEDADAAAASINENIPYDLQAQSIRDQNPQLFDWLGLQDVNAVIIICLILLVCSINMISALLIIILERTATIGILKSLGAGSTSIRSIFIYIASYLLAIGMLAGNVAGIILCMIQKETGIIKLDQTSYYIPYVPVYLDPLHVLLLNAGTLIVCVFFMVLPSVMIVRISPIRAMRFS